MSAGITLCTTTASCYLHLFCISIFLSVPLRKFTRKHLCVTHLSSSSKTCRRLEIIELNRHFTVFNVQMSITNCSNNSVPWASEQSSRGFGALLWMAHILKNNSKTCQMSMGTSWVVVLWLARCGFLQWSQSAAKRWSPSPLFGEGLRATYPL